MYRESTKSCIFWGTHPHDSTLEFSMSIGSLRIPHSQLPSVALRFVGLIAFGASPALRLLRFGCLHQLRRTAHGNPWEPKEPPKSPQKTSPSSASASASAMDSRHKQDQDQVSEVASCWQDLAVLLRDVVGINIQEPSNMWLGKIMCKN